MTKRTLHLMHNSMSFAMSEQAIETDMKWLFEHEPDAVSFTEMGQHIRTFNRVCRERGYHPVVFPRATATPIAVRIQDDIKLKDRGMVYVFDGGGGRGYPNKSVNWVKLKFYDTYVWYHTAHWVPIGNNPGLTPKHIQQTKAMASITRKHGKMEGYSFYSGDVNDDDDPKGDTRTNWNAIFRGAGLMSMWDEQRVYPPTMGAGRTIDVIGKYIENGVKNTRYKAYTLQHSDHRPISGWYELETTAAGTGGGQSYAEPWTPTPGDHSGDPSDDDPYVTGGNVSWADYRDKEIYKYAQAVDDSDLFNG